MARRTKIVATIGPASREPGVLRDLIAAGVDMARISLSHASLDEARQLLGRVRAAARSQKRIIGVLADLPGPKVRAAPFPGEGVQLDTGSTVEVEAVAADAGADRAASGAGRIVVDRPELLEALREGDRIAIGDGGIQLLARTVGGGRAVAEVVTGGWVQGRPGVSLPSGGPELPGTTAADLRLLEALCDAGVDAVAISFVRSAEDIQRARAVTGPDGPMVVAKIETQEAVDAADAVIAAAGAVMVARGDLGIRCAMEDVPHYQKRIIRAGVSFGRPVITATQMLESMVRAPVPTRAEVSDVANAVFDGTSALMLSAETAVGLHPVESVLAMARIAQRAEREFDYQGWGSSLGRQQLAGTTRGTATERITAAVSAAAWRAAVDAEAAAIIACTNQGGTARGISRFRPPIPILGVTPSAATARQLSMSWGVTPVVTNRHGSTDDIVWFAIEGAAASGIVRKGDLVAVLVGSPTDPDPVTDSLRLVRVR